MGTLLELQHVAPPFEPEEAPPSVPAATGPERLRNVVNRECTFVWRTLRRFGVPSSIADDATQSVFLAFAAHAAEVRVESERSFLIGTCLRVAANVRRGLSRNKEVTGVSIDEPAPHDPERLLHLKRRRQALDLALEGLPAEQRSVFVLFELEGFSLPEIASSLDVPLGTATSRLRRARSSMEAWAKKQDAKGDWR
jgi:RNA polymerase sigma-70 factor (ECF subfamily)